MKTTRILTLVICALLVLGLAACQQTGEQQQTTEQTTNAATDEQTTQAPDTQETTQTPETEEPTQETTQAPETEAPTQETTQASETEAPTQETTQAPETEQPTQESTEEQTTEAVTEQETELLGREDYADDDPNNPYLNLIEVGMSYDGMTKCYDGRYDFGYTICRTEDGEEFSCMQDAIDYAAGYGCDISMMADTNVCLKLYIPEDGEFYRIAYNWYNIDFVFNYGVVYDDGNPKNEIVGYAYYSDLYQLDWIMGLENTHVWMMTDTEGFAPGRYLMSESDDVESEFMYSYTKVEEIFEWPGLPRAEVLPE